MEIFKILLIVLASIWLIFILIWKRKNKHHVNINKADQILLKLSQIEYNGAKINYLRKINPYVFEELILTGFEKKGYKIYRNKKYSGDGGIDGQIEKNGKKYLIQAKRYSKSINPYHVLEFSNVIKSKNVDGGFFVHTGRTGIKSLENKNDLIEFISGEKLLRLIKN